MFSLFLTTKLFPLFLKYNIDFRIFNLYYPSIKDETNILANIFLKLLLFSNITCSLRELQDEK